MRNWGASAGRVIPPFETFATAVIGAIVIAAAILSTSIAVEKFALLVGVTVVAWCASAVMSRRRKGESLTAFRMYLPGAADAYMLVSIVVLTSLALDLNERRDPGVTESIVIWPPVLHIDLAPQYLVLAALGTTLVGWRGASGAPRAQTMLLLQLALFSVFFRPLLFASEGATPVYPYIWANVLVLLLLHGSEQTAGMSVAWRAYFARPLLALALAGVVATALSVHPHASLTALLTLAPLGVIALLMTSWLQTPAARTLAWASVVVPALVLAGTIIFRMTQIWREMGTEYTLHLRFWMIGLESSGGLGLDLAVAGVMLAGGLAVAPAAWRWPLIAGLVLVIPAFVVTYSITAVMALGGGLAVLGVSFAWRRLGPGATARLFSSRVAIGAGVAAVAVLVAMAAIPNPVRRGFVGVTSDPSGGLPARTVVWEYATKNALHHPVAGTGLGVAYARSQYAEGYPDSRVTRVFETRALVGLTQTGWREMVRTQPHNIGIAVFEGMGVLGVLAFGWLLVAVASRSIVAVFREQADEQDGAFTSSFVFIAALAGVLSWHVGSLGAQPLPVTPTVLLILGLTVGLVRERDASEEAPEPVRWRLTPAWGAAGMLVLLLAVVRPIAADRIFEHAEDRVRAGDLASAGDYVDLAELLDPLNASYHSSEVTWFFDSDLDRAVGAQELMNTLQREYAPGHVRLGWLYWLSAREGSAEREFRRGTDLDPWNVLGSNPQLALGLMQVNRGATDEARAELRSAMILDPGAVVDSAWQPAGDEEAADFVISSAFGQYASREDLRRELACRALLLRCPRDPFAQPAVASRDAITLGSLAESAAREADDLSSTNASRSEDLRFAAARVYVVAGMYDDAEPLLKELSDAQPDEPRYHYHLGLVQLQRGALDRAQEQFRATLDTASDRRGIDSHVPFAHVGLGNIYSRNGDHRRAALEFERAVNSYRHGYLQNGYIALSRELELAGDIESALTALRREVFLNERPSARTSLSHFYARNGDPERADGEARRAEELAR